MVQAAVISSRPTYSASNLPDVDVPVEILRIANRLVLSEDEIRGICVLFTSTTQGEGKTVILRHLARVMAKFLGKNVLVIELQDKKDEQEPASLSVSAKPYSFENTSMKNVTKLKFRTDYSGKYRYLLDHLDFLRGQYDIVLVEGPPVNQNTTIDPVVLSPIFDITLLVFQQKITPSNEINDSLDLLKNAGAKDVRLLINQSTILDEEVSRWNLPARVPRLFKRIDVLWRHFRSRSKKSEAEKHQANPNQPNEASEGEGK